MKKTIVAVGIILLLVGIMIIVSTHENQTQKKDPYTVTTPGGTISIVSIPQAQSKAPDLQEVMGYIFGGGILFAGGYLLLNSKQKELLDNND